MLNLASEEARVAARLGEAAMLRTSGAIAELVTIGVTSDKKLLASPSWFTIKFSFYFFATHSLAD
jgi:hypothetical protein